jgi:creatinine amidohydrolase/Fe(II)-dependent formamide hydrolase-like protein
MTERRAVELGRLSWKEVEGILPLNPVILIPIGTVEQHEPHMLVNADNTRLRSALALLWQIHTWTF